MEDVDLEHEKKLTDIFEEANNLYDEILNTDQPTNSGEIQVSMRILISLKLKNPAKAH